MKIPLEVSKQKEQKKFQSKRNDRFILDNKIVSRTREPTLFNLQSAHMALNQRMGSIPLRATRQIPTQTNQATLSVETLFMMNVALDDLPKDFSLIETSTAVPVLSNPNITDLVLAKRIYPVPTPISQNFPSVSDPIYNLDEGNHSSNLYAQRYVGPLPRTVDVSKIVSDLNILNQSTNYYGKTKYFKL